MAGPWIDYLARCSALLAAGRPAVDIAVFVGEEAPVTGLFEHELDEAGQVGGEGLLPDLGAVAADVEVVDEPVGLGGRLVGRDRGDVDARGEAAQLGHPGVVGGEVDVGLGRHAHEPPGTPHPHHPGRGHRGRHRGRPTPAVP